MPFKILVATQLRFLNFYSKSCDFFFFFILSHIKGFRWAVMNLGDPADDAAFK